jgi:hypothetical protein
MQSPARFLIALVITCAAILIGIGTVNFAVDANGAYGSGTNTQNSFAARYVQALTTSPHGLIQSPLERPIKIELAKRRNTDCYIIGSSHDMAINLQTLPLLQHQCASLVNLAVSGGGFEETVAFLALLADKAPGTRIFISIPPWFFRPYVDAHWTQIETQYIAARDQFGLDAQKTWFSAFSPTLTLINADYFLHNLKELMGYSLKAGMTITQAGPGAPQGKAAVTLADGSYRRPDSPPGPEHLIGNGAYKLTSRVAVIPSLVSDFETVLRRVRQHGHRVTLLLTPYHPKVFDCQPVWVCDSLKATETAARDLARRLELPLLGGYAPAAFGLTHSDFEDDHHVAAHSLWRLGNGARETSK